MWDYPQQIYAQMAKIWHIDFANSQKSSYGKAYVCLSTGIVKEKARSNFLRKQIVSKCIQGSEIAIESKRLKSEQNLVHNLDQIKDLPMRVATTRSQSSEIH